MTDGPAYPHKIVSTTEGRQNFPELLQDAFGEQTIVGARRYDRFLGGIVSKDALQLLAGGELHPDHKLRIRNAARNLLQELGLL